MKVRQGFTLMELMVVLLIIGILSTVALRTIDATRNRSLFDQTTKKMNQLVQAIVGNPDLTFDGRRVDFGYFGDMEKLPPGPDLRDLVINTTGSVAWHGPYLHLTDTTDFLLDGWGNPYAYNPAGTIKSLGDGKYPMTVSVTDSLSQLYNNTISGTMLDADGNPPGTQVDTIAEIRLYYNNPSGHANPLGYLVTHPDPGGYYEFSLTSPPPGPDTVPIGIHKLLAIIPGETLTRYVTVEPRSRTVVDLKFSKSFWERLRLSGPPSTMFDRTGFLIHIVNTQTDDVTVNWLQFVHIITPDSAYMRNILINGNEQPGFPMASGGKKSGDTVHFTSWTVPANMANPVDFQFEDFRVDTAAGSPPANVVGKTFQLLFSDGSEVKFTVPNP